MSPIPLHEFLLLLPEIFLVTAGMLLLVGSSAGRGISSRAYMPGRRRPNKGVAPYTLL